MNKNEIEIGAEYWIWPFDWPTPWTVTVQDLPTPNTLTFNFGGSTIIQEMDRNSFLAAKATATVLGPKYDLRREALEARWVLSKFALSMVVSCATVVITVVSCAGAVYLLVRFAGWVDQ